MSRFPTDLGAGLEAKARSYMDDLNDLNLIANEDQRIEAIRFALNMNRLRLFFDTYTRPEFVDLLSDPDTYRKFKRASKKLGEAALILTGEECRRVHKEGSN